MLTAGKPFTREDLVSLKRADIQRLCKDYGVRANMKTEALIELLLDSIQSNMSPLVGPRPPQPPPAQRRVSTRSSTRVSSLRSRGTSVSSSSTSLAASSSNSGSSGPPCTNKSKLTQYKLGVGRPSAPAESGLRFSSRSSSKSRIPRSRTFRPEATIAEEPETSQHASIPEQNVGPSTSRMNSTSAEDDVVTRLGRLESTFREADMKHQFESLRHVPSQVACLIASMQQREAEIMGLRGELDVCKTEILALRREASRVVLLEDQIRAFKDTLEQLKASSSNSDGFSKAKTTRRGPTPFTDSNRNLTSTVQTNVPLCNAPMTPQPTHAHEHPVTPTKRQRGPSEIALGKRPHAPSPDNDRGAFVIPEHREAPHREPDRRVQPERKRTRITADGRPLQEHRSESERPGRDHEAREDCIGSAGSIVSGLSTQPSVSTPPPAANGADHFDQVIAQQEDLMSDDLDMLDFCNAASSTPRDDIFNFFDKESFSQLSATATKLAAHCETQESDDNRPPTIPQEPRRISTTVARPVTPPRPSGPGRFRIPVEVLRPIKEDMASFFDPYAEGLYTLPFESGNFGRRDLPNQNENGESTAPANPLALGYGLAAAGGMLVDDSPVRPTARTMYDTEVQNDTRFGDFGRDTIATSSNMALHWNF